MSFLIKTTILSTIFTTLIVSVIYYLFMYKENTIEEPSFNNIKIETKKNKKINIKPIKIRENKEQTIKKNLDEKELENIDDNLFIRVDDSLYKTTKKTFLPYHPIRILNIKNNIYYLINGQLYNLDLKNSKSNKVKISEDTDLVDFVYDNENNIFLLDKTNKIYNFNIKSKISNLYFMPYSFPEEPSPQNISLTFYNKNLYVLDSARNQIWKVVNNKLLGFFKKEPLVWQLKETDRNITKACDFFLNKNLFYILKQSNDKLNQEIDVYNGEKLESKIRLTLNSQYRYTKMYTRENLNKIYLLKTYDSTITEIDKKTNVVQEYMIKVENKDLPIYDIIFDNNKFFILAGNYLIIKNNLEEFKNQENSQDILQEYLEEKGLNNFIIPVKTSNIDLPKDAGVFPGARRLYRYGIHEGIDFFEAAERKIFISNKTPVIAAEDGIIKRVDYQYKEMTQNERNVILSRCNKNKDTSPEDADKLKGRQVVIEHNNGIISVYCHLSKTANIKVGHKINKGDIIGYIGNSGTSDGILNNKNNLHLHFEIHIDDKSEHLSYYLGKNISIEETMQIYEKVFSKSN